MTPVELGILVAFSAGVLSFLSPCVLPLVPSYLSFVTGMTLEDIEEGVDRRQVMLHSSFFVAGFTVVFLLMGATATFIGQAFHLYEVWLMRIGGVVVIVLGLHVMGVLRLMPLMKGARMRFAEEPSGRLGAVGVGAAFGASWIPCTGPILGGILTMAWVDGTFWNGMGLLAVYSLGLAIPFLLAAAALGRFLAFVRRFGRYRGSVEVVAGGLLVLVGFLMVTGAFTELNRVLLPLTPDFLYERI